MMNDLQGRIVMGILLSWCLKGP